MYNIAGEYTFVSQIKNGVLKERDELQTVAFNGLEAGGWFRIGSMHVQVSVYCADIHLVLHITLSTSLVLSLLQFACLGIHSSLQASPL